jgi:2-polyprenyl-6-methoxyphenol hydroxylase-like FAD-dependent oxidoreductase
MAGTSTTSNVIVVGAGPTGLLLAGDLAAAGHPVTVLERRSPEVSNLTRAFGVHARTLEVLDARGLADPLVKTGRTIADLRLFRRLTLDLSTLPSQFPYLLITPQYEVEHLLESRAVEAGVELRYHTELVGLDQDPDGVTARVRAADGTESRLRAAYLAGTDGHRSTVRAALGLPFPGESVIRSIVLADVRLAEEPSGVLTVNGVGDTFAFIAPFGDGYYRIFGWQRDRDVPDDTPLELDEVKQITRRALGSDFGMYEARWLSRFHSDERQVPAYRVGRVFLAGDAAHVHSPAGGQGMNTGLQDAANLSWKLAAVLDGSAGDPLLDSYHAERHRVGRAVLRSSGTLVRFAMAHTVRQRAARAVFARMVSTVPPIRRRAVGMLTGIGFAYPAPRGAHRLTGKRAPDLPLAGGTRLYEALRAGRFVLVTPSGAAAPPDHRYESVEAAGQGSGRTLLVRPDGYIAWASDRPEPAGTIRAALTAALRRGRRAPS